MRLPLPLVALKLEREGSGVLNEPSKRTHQTGHGDGKLSDASTVTPGKSEHFGAIER